MYQKNWINEWICNFLYYFYLRIYIEPQKYYKIHRHKAEENLNKCNK